MSEALQHYESDNNRPKLHLVQAGAEVIDGEYSRQVNEYIAKNNAYLRFYVPTSVEDANDIAGKLQQDAARIQKTPAGYEMDGVEIDPLEAEDLIRSSEQGLDVWKLTDEQRQQARAVIATASYSKQLDPALKAELRSFKLTPNEPNQETFDRYKGLMQARLDFDQELSGADTSSAAPETDATGQVSSGELGKEADRTAEALDAIEPVAAAKPARSRKAQAAATKTTEPAPGATAEAGTAGQTPETGPEAAQTGRYEQLRDIVSVGKTGNTVHQFGSGKFMSKQQRELVEEHQDLIREGMTDRARALKHREEKSALMKQMYGEDAYAERFASNPNVDPDAWKAREYAAPGQTAEDTATRRLLPYVRTDGVRENVPAEVTQKIWETLSEEDRQTLRDYKTAEDAEAARAAAPLVRGTDGNVELRGKAESLTERDVPEPVTDPSPAGLKARLKRVWAWANAKYLTYDGVVKNYMQDSEKGKRRHRAVAVTVGALAMTAGAAIAYQKLKSGHSGGSGFNAGQDYQRHLDSMPSTTGGGSHEAVKNYQEIQLRAGSGNGLWQEERLRHPGASEQQIYHRVQRDLELNHLTWKEAHDIDGTVKITR